MKTLWNKEQEISFFKEKLAENIPPEDLFYETDEQKLVAYWEKIYTGKKRTIQSRNSHIGSFTEKWTQNLFSEIATQHNAYAIRGAVCEKLGLPKNSNADVAICKKNNISQNPEDILMIIEVKMSIVWNWEFIKNTQQIKCLGDYTTHTGTPSLLRSDSMLKAIGKSINVRISDEKASSIPIIVLGNTPISKSYISKVNHLKIGGFIQGFWSVNSELPENNNQKGFISFNNYDKLKLKCHEILTEKKEFFSSNLNKKALGKIIEHANKEKTLETKAKIFLQQLRAENHD